MCTGSVQVGLEERCDIAQEAREGSTGERVCAGTEFGKRESILFQVRQGQRGLMCCPGNPGFTWAEAF